MTPPCSRQSAQNDISGPHPSPQIRQYALSFSLMLIFSVWLMVTDILLHYSLSGNDHIDCRVFGLCDLRTPIFSAARQIVLHLKPHLIASPTTVPGFGALLLPAGFGPLSRYFFNHTTAASPTFPGRPLDRVDISLGNPQRQYGIPSTTKRFRYEQ